MIIKTDQESIADYLRDASNYQGSCSAVCFPESISEVQQLAAECNSTNTPLTVAGTGTGLTGARVPDGGMVVSLERMNRILAVDAEGYRVTVEPAVLLGDLQNHLQPLGLLYPPNPTETNCAIGGTIATNASGAKTFLYGPTRSYVQALTLVLPDGELLTLRRGTVFADGYQMDFQSDSGKAYSITLPETGMPEVKNAAGYYIKKDMDLIDLFIGSEGTLGIITGAELGLVPLPKEVLSWVIFFNNEEDALNFTDRARALSYAGRNGEGVLNARAIEYFDGHSLDILREDFPQTPEAKGAVWVEQSVDELEEEITDAWITLADEFHAPADWIWAAIDEPSARRIRDFRHALAYKVNEYITRKGLRKLGTDVAVPDEHFIPFYFDATSLVKESGLQYAAYGHFGNSHLHLNMLPANEEEFLLGKKLYGRICQMAVDKGGTVSAEHGIGKLKHEYLMMMYGEEGIKKFAAVKKALDPNGIMGRGTMFKIN